MASPSLDPVRRVRAALLYAGLLPILMNGCEAEAVELVQEISAARGECTPELLRQSDEACVEMMGRYAGMGTELIHTYIGGVKALDRALERMPAPAFDTTGLGYALSSDFRGGDPLGAGASPRLVPSGSAYSYAPASRAPQEYPPLEGAARARMRAGDRGTLGESRAWARASSAGPAAPRSLGGGSGVWEGGRRDWRFERPAGSDGRYWPGRSSTGDARARAYYQETRWYDPVAYGRASGWERGYLYGSAFDYLDSGPYGYFYDPYRLYGGPDGYRPGDFYGDGTAYPYARGPQDAFGYEPVPYAGRAPGWGQGYGDGYGYGGMPAYGGAYGRSARGDYGYGYDLPPVAGYGYDESDRAADRFASDPRQGYAGDDLPPEEAWGYAPVESDAPPEDVFEAESGAAPAVARTLPGPPRHRPGILLPPEERLRRPWLDD